MFRHAQHERLRCRNGVFSIIDPSKLDAKPYRLAQKKDTSKWEGLQSKAGPDDPPALARP